MMDPANIVPGSLLAGFDTSWRYAAYIALFIGFAIKVPLFPFHTWLPDAHVEAPTPISVILAGVLLKMGTYGMLRISFPIFPDAARYFAWELALLGVISMVYGALVAMAQTDFKKLIAYSSVSHMGIVVLGMASMNTQGMIGAVFQMFNHGTITAMLFLIVGVIYDRAHTRGLNEFGGLMNKMPRYAAVMTIAFFAALGLPGLSGFISEMFSLLGAFQTFQTLTIIGAVTIVLTAGYMLWVLQRVFLGTLPEKWKGLTDMDGRETFMLASLAVIVIFLGIYPAPVLDLMTTSMNHLAELLQRVRRRHDADCTLGGCRWVMHLVTDLSRFLPELALTATFLLAILVDLIFRRTPHSCGRGGDGRVDRERVPRAGADRDELPALHADARRGLLRGLLQVADYRHGDPDRRVLAVVAGAERRGGGAWASTISCSWPSRWA